jgi:hypothetical protein
MSLCTTCHSLDLLNIPKLPASCNAYNVKNDSAALIVVHKRRTAQTEEDQSAYKSLGLPFHQSLPDLQAAATNCSICRVVEQDIAHFRTEFNDPEQEEQRRRKKQKGPDWQMWLAKGVNDISGFMVVSADVENKSVVWVLSAVGLCVDGNHFLSYSMDEAKKSLDDDPLSNVVAGRKIDVDASSDTTVQRALKWIRECDAEHGESKCFVANAALPLRVLDVNSTHKYRVSLYTSQGEKGRYATLSHVGDTNNLYKLISSNIEDRRHGFDMDDLPQTFQDAIRMTRKLGLQYLWIDALW